MTSTPYYDSLVPLRNYGETVRELNDSLLVGQHIIFCRPMQMEDAALLGDKSVAAAFSEAGVTDPEGTKMTLESADGDELCFSVAEWPLLYVTGTVAGFLKGPDGIENAVFSEPFITPLGDELSQFALNEATRMIFR